MKIKVRFAFCLKIFLVILLLFNFTLIGFKIVKAFTTIALMKGSWDIIGLDSNKPVDKGFDSFLIQIHITDISDGENGLGVIADFQWTSSNSYIDLHINETTTKTLGDIIDGGVKEVFYHVKVARDKNTWSTSRSYSINISGTNFSSQKITGTLYVEKLVSQNRNYVISITSSS